MPNGRIRAIQWIEFIVERCPFPNRVALAAQFANARLEEFCGCGCHSFAIAVDDSTRAPRIASGDRYGLVYEAVFRNLDAAENCGAVEILLFADMTGRLRRVDIQCPSNSHPVPEHVRLESQPFHVYESDRLISS
jgi:hypothetical protein